MVFLKHIRTATLLATTVLGGTIPFAYGMDEDQQGYTPLPFKAIQVDATKMVSIQEEGSGFRSLTPLEAKETIATLNSAYTALKIDPNHQSIPFVKLNVNSESALFFKEKIGEPNIYRVIDPATANEKLQSMLAAYIKASLVPETNVTPSSVVPAALPEEEEAARMQAETLRLQEEERMLRAALAKQKEEEAAEALRQQQEEVAALKAQLAAQAETLRLQEEAAIAQAVARALETQRQQQLAEDARQQAEAAQAALLQQQQAATQSQLIFGRTPERVERNVNTEAERAVQGISNVFSGKSWSYGRKIHKKK